MIGQMMDSPLTLGLVRERVGRYHRPVTIATNTAGGVARATYGDVLDRADRLAHALTAFGVAPGDVVGTVMANTQQHLEAYLAVPCMGAVLHTLNFRLSPDQLAFIANSAGDRVLIVDSAGRAAVDAVRDRLTTVEHVVVVEEDLEPLLARQPSGPFAWPDLDERSACAMCFTSGTTGDPKGIVYSHRSTVLHALGLLYADTFAVSARDVVLPVVPMFHVNSWGFPYAALVTGARLVMPGPFLQADRLADLIAAERVTVAAGVPTVWQALVEELTARPRDVSALRCVPCGGAAIPETLMAKFDAIVPGALTHAWGLTETSPIATIATLPPEADAWTDDARLRARLTQGRALIGIDIRIWSLEGGEAPWDGETIGEIHVRGPWVASGYFGGHDADRFADEWFRTGDVAVGNPDGTVQIVDRTKDVIKSGGEWISSVALEGTILEHPSVRECAVIGRFDPRWSERPVACVVLREGEALELDPLRDWLGDRVPRFWLPDDVFAVDAIPKTGTGKMDKRALRDAYASAGRRAE